VVKIITYWPKRNYPEIVRLEGSATPGGTIGFAHRGAHRGVNAMRIFALTFVLISSAVTPALARPQANTPAQQRLGWVETWERSGGGVTCKGKCSYEPKNAKATEWSCTTVGYADRKCAIDCGESQAPKRRLGCTTIIEEP
jgi:hypothetical protein